MNHDTARAFRDALGRYATGVAVVCAPGSDGRPMGMTINSFASVSLEPPLILWCVDSQSSVAGAYAAAQRFTVSVLSAGQEALARRFADADMPAVDRFDGAAVVCLPCGLPVLAEAAAYFECEREKVYPGGDHQIILGRVVDFGSRPGTTLTFLDGQFGR